MEARLHLLELAASGIEYRRLLFLSGLFPVALVDCEKALDKDFFPLDFCPRFGISSALGWSVCACDFVGFGPTRERLIS